VDPPESLRPGRAAVRGVLHRARHGQVPAAHGLQLPAPRQAGDRGRSRAMREWVEETYPALRERARSEGAGVLFGDQVRGALRPARRAHLRSQGPDTDRGADRNRFGLSAMSTISTRGELHFTVLNQSFNAEVFIAFLHRLLGQFEEEIHLVVDGHPAHRAKKVVDWVARRPDQIELHFLPAYARPMSTPMSWSMPISSAPSPPKGHRRSGPDGARGPRLLPPCPETPGLGARLFSGAACEVRQLLHLGSHHCTWRTGVRGSLGA
jgi:hypothetical protein